MAKKTSMFETTLQGKIIKKWSDFYFILHPDSLDFYISDTAIHFQGSISLKVICDVRNVHYPDYEFSISLRSVYHFFQLPSSAGV